MADVSNHYTSKENLTTINKHIEAINDNISSNQTKILAKLSDMKAAMIVDGKRVDNKSADIEKVMNQYSDNFMGCVQSYKGAIRRYETAVSDSVKVIGSLEVK